MTEEPNMEKPVTSYLYIYVKIKTGAADGEFGYFSFV